MIQIKKRPDDALLLNLNRFMIKIMCVIMMKEMIRESPVIIGTSSHLF